MSLQISGYTLTGIHQRQCSKRQGGSAAILTPQQPNRPMGFAMLGMLCSNSASTPASVPVLMTLPVTEKALTFAG